MTENKSRRPDNRGHPTREQKGERRLKWWAGPASEIKFVSPEAGGGYILAAGASLDNPKVENLKAMAAAAKEYGVYQK